MLCYPTSNWWLLLAARDWEGQSPHREGWARQETVSKGSPCPQKSETEPKMIYVHLSQCFTWSQRSSPHFQAWRGKAMEMSKADSAQIHEISAWILMCLRDAPNTPSLQVARIPQHEPEKHVLKVSDYANPLWPSSPLTFSSGAIIFTKVNWSWLHQLINRCGCCALLSVQSTPSG